MILPGPQIDDGAAQLLINAVTRQVEISLAPQKSGSGKFADAD
jgi:hypothetical protein